MTATGNLWTCGPNTQWILGLALILTLKLTLIITLTITLSLTLVPYPYVPKIPVRHRKGQPSQMECIVYKMCILPDGGFWGLAPPTYPNPLR